MSKPHEREPLIRAPHSTRADRPRAICSSNATPPLTPLARDLAHHQAVPKLARALYGSDFRSEDRSKSVDRYVFGSISTARRRRLLCPKPLFFVQYSARRVDTFESLVNRSQRCLKLGKLCREVCSSAYRISLKYVALNEPDSNTSEEFHACRG
jgi:hypothetical protein